MGGFRNPALLLVGEGAIILGRGVKRSAVLAAQVCD